MIELFRDVIPSEPVNGYETFRLGRLWLRITLYGGLWIREIPLT